MQNIRNIIPDGKEISKGAYILRLWLQVVFPAIVALLKKLCTIEK